MKAYRSTVVLLVLSLAGSLIPAPQLSFAQAFFDQERSFVVDRACEAHTSIKKKTGPVTLRVGQAYRAMGENTRSGATHAFIEVDGKRKWAALACGHFAGIADNGGVVPAHPGEDTSCLPFFDDHDNPVNVGFGARPT